MIAKTFTPRASRKKMTDPVRTRGKAAPQGRKLEFLGEPGDRAICRQILAEIDKAKKIVITGHERPDGDCLGSTIALCAILQHQGYPATAVLDPIPERFEYLNASGIVSVPKPGEKLDADLAIVLDAAEFERLGGLDSRSFEGVRILNIDHHISNTSFGDFNWIESGASAVGELIWRIASSLDWEVPKLALDAIYVALVTDTGQFAYSNTTPRVLRMAASLIEAGVDSEVTWRRIYLNKSQEELELEARARQSLEVWADGQISSIALTHQDFVETGTSPEVTQELVSIPRSLRGSKVAVFFYEIEDGRTTKISIRSVREIDACALARAFGGGGHRQAAGCSIAAPLSGAKRQFMTVAEALLKDMAF